MPFNFLQKINFKIWLPSSLGSSLILAYFLKGFQEYTVFGFFFLATYLNLFILVYTLDRFMLAREVSESGKRDHFMIVFLFSSKMFLLFGALAISFHFMGNRVVIPLINYVIQIFVLVLSFKRGSESK